MFYVDVEVVEDIDDVVDNVDVDQGAVADLLVDTGVGVHSLPNYLTWSGLRRNNQKPLNVVLTHCHFDHR